VLGVRHVGLLVLGLAGCGASPPVATAARPPPEDEAADYLVVAPSELLPPLAPLLAHRRAQGHVVRTVAAESVGDARAESLRDRVHAEWRASGGRLRHLLLVGDAPRADEPDAGKIATFYLPKLDYFTHDHERRHRLHLHLPHAEHDEHAYPSDHPYAVLDGDPFAPVLAVGRVPARTPEEVAGFVDKLVAYESGPVVGAWPARLVVVAGPARYGVLLDAVIERLAFDVLDREIPRDYELRVLFAKPGSPYADRLDRLPDRLVREASAGALMLAYVGHSSPAYLDTVEWRGTSYLIGSRRDFERMDIASGGPLLISLSCDVGAFDMSQGRHSIGEAAVLNPRGPIAAFAASRVSHPYPNALYGAALVDALLVARPPTLGEGIAAAKRSLRSRSLALGELLSGIAGDALKHEHVSLYNLLGDPATRLRYPGAARVTAQGGAHAPGSGVAVRVEADGFDGGVAAVTIERPRNAVDPAARPRDLEALSTEEALARMAEIYEASAATALASAEATLSRGGAQVVVAAPTRPGSYVIKAVVRASAVGVATGHAALDVRAP
jgi:hypothetical protein